MSEYVSMVKNNFSASERIPLAGGFLTNWKPTARKDFYQIHATNINLANLIRHYPEKMFDYFLQLGGSEN
jgi:hypothetical protein